MTSPLESNLVRGAAGLYGGTYLSGTLTSAPPWRAPRARSIMRSYIPSISIFISGEDEVRRLWTRGEEGVRVSLTRSQRQIGHVCATRGAVLMRFPG